MDNAARNIVDLNVDLKSVVIVEDDPCLQSLLSHTLKPLCDKLTITDSIKVAIDFLSTEKQTLIILDLQLVDGKGVEVIEFIESNPTGVNFLTPIIVLSGSIDTRFVKTYSMRIHRSQSKPIKPHQLLSLVKGIL